jgi:hypothetical protein
MSDSIFYTRLKYSCVFIAVLAIFIFVPISTTAVPEWRVRVVDTNGDPRPGVLIRQSWKHYSYGDEEAYRGEEELTSDGSGVVVFRERTVRASLFYRVFIAVCDVLKLFIRHSSSGVHAAIMAPYEHGPPYISYDGDGDPPAALVLKD